MNDDTIIDLGLGGGDTLQRIVLVLPCYVNVPTSFMTNLLSTVSEFPGDCAVNTIQGPYVDQSMRHAADDLRKLDNWDRMIVVEQDMLIPRDGLIKHALHTDDIVGSVYFQHTPPHYLNCMFRYEGKFGYPRPAVVDQMVNHPALWKCDAVGLGFTSIARRVVDEWPDDVPMFRTDYEHQSRHDSYNHGCVSHDVWFCGHARSLGYDVFLDSSIKCGHITEGWTSEKHYFAINKPDKKSSLLLPYDAQKRLHVPRLAKAH